MFGWFKDRRKQKERVMAEANRLIAQHGSQAQYVLAAQIREYDAKGEPTKELWRVLREVKRLSGDEGLDTATRWTGSK